MYKNMTKLLSPAQKGEYEISNFEILENNGPAMIAGILPGTYVKLTCNGEVIMSDTPMEKRTNREFCRKAHGDVLIGGLGIGMICMAIQDNDEVRTITVIEKSKDVIDLVASQLPLNPKVNIIHADVYDWKPQTGMRFDCIYMDIWSYINRDIWKKEMLPLKRKYAHYLKPLSESPMRYHGYWAEWYAKNNCKLW